MLVFGERGNRSTWRKTSRSMTVSPGIGLRPHWWKVDVLTTVPSLLPKSICRWHMLMASFNEVWHWGFGGTMNVIKFLIIELLNTLEKCIQENFQPYNNWIILLLLSILGNWWNDSDCRKYHMERRALLLGSCQQSWICRSSTYWHICDRSVY